MIDCAVSLVLKVLSRVLLGLLLLLLPPFDGRLRAGANPRPRGLWRGKDFARAPHHFRIAGHSSEHLLLKNFRVAFQVKLRSEELVTETSSFTFNQFDA